MIASVLLAFVSLAQPSPDGEPPVVLENGILRVDFSRRDGSIVGLRNLRAGLDLVSPGRPSARPWALLLAPFDLVTDFENFKIAPSAGDGGGRVDLRWETPYKITIKAEARLAKGSDELELRCSAENAGDRAIIAFRYPAIGGIGTLSGDGAGDRLLHSAMMGALFRDPFHLFRAGDPIPAGRGLVISRYPNGFGGSALQLLAYYAEGRGGFYLACEDEGGGDKDLNFFKAPGEGGLVCEIAHISQDARPGKSLAPGYPVAIAALTEGTWYEAAERYRAWASRQSWCRRGTLRDRVEAGDASRWLLEEIGAAGMWWPFRGDIREDVLRTRRLFGAPLLHLELWWSHGPSLETARSDGDRFGPFYFPFLALKGREAFREHEGDAIFPAWTPISPDWIAMCPVQLAWRSVACESAEDLAGSGPLRHHQIWIDENRTGCRADCLYYDIGPCAGVPTHCYAPGHAHPPGAGGAVTAAYVSLFDETRRRATRARGAYVPVGTECASEPFVGCLDLYFARNAGLNPDMEVFPYVREKTWLPDGQMEIVPLFPFVYHEHGPVALQGIYPEYPWNVREAEDFYTWAEARTVLWGGLIIAFPEASGAGPAEGRVRFLRSLAAARTGFARELLAYGRMVRPPAIACGTLEIDHGLAEGGWLRKVRAGRAKPEPPADPKSKDLSVEEWAKGLLALPSALPASRTLKVPSVLSQAYTLGDDRLGILLVNLRAASEETVRLPADPVACGLRPGAYELWQAGPSGRKSLGKFTDRSEVELRLPPREVILLESVRIADR
jgi:hypothetical protein